MGQEMVYLPLDDPKDLRSSKQTIQGCFSSYSGYVSPLFPSPSPSCSSLGVVLSCSFSIGKGSSLEIGKNGGSTILGLSADPDPSSIVPRRWRSVETIHMIKRRLGKLTKECKALPRC